MSLADVQAAIRGYVVAGRDGGLAGALMGGRHPLRRLAIHRRHYRASLTAALIAKFPGTAWLIGERRFLACAETFVAARPPAAPCIAEYGAAFPHFLGARERGRAPYAESFATLEWHVGHVSVAVDAEPADPVAFASLGPPSVVRVTLQPGVRYLRADWPVDTLFRFFLTDAAPETFRMESEAIALQVRGARGEFRFDRLSPPRFAFRSTLASGADLGTALDAALGADPSTDVATELAALVSERLVTSIVPRADIGARPTPGAP